MVQVKREILEAKVYIGKLEGNAPVAVLEKLREVEGRAASLRNRTSSLEVEIENYQKYMKETVLQYKRQIQMLRSQLAALKGGKLLPTANSTALEIKDGGLELPYCQMRPRHQPFCPNYFNVNYVREIFL